MDLSIGWLGLLLLTCHIGHTLVDGRRIAVRNTESDEDGQGVFVPLRTGEASRLRTRKSAGSPTLIFGNPSVYGSGFGETKAPISPDASVLTLQSYEEKTAELLDTNADEAFIRNLIVRRIRRSAKQTSAKEDEEEEEDQLKRKKKLEQEFEEEELEKARLLTSTSSSTTTTKVSNSTTTTKAPQGQGSIPIPQFPTTSKPGINGTTKLPIPFPIPPGKPPPGGRGGLPPGLFPPSGPGGGKRPNMPPFPLPPHLLFGGNNRNQTTRKPAKKGELYLPDDYSNLEIPKIDAGKLFGIKTQNLSPVPVLVFLNIRSVRDIDEINEEVVLDMDMKVEWVDGILFDPLNAIKGGKPSKQTTLNPIFLRKIWQPDIYIDEIVRVHRTELMATPHTLLFSATTGLVSYTFRIAVRLSCDMNFYYFPADTHKCEMHLRSYSYFDADLDLGWLRNGVYLQDPSDPNFALQVDDIKKLKIKQVFNEANNDTYDGLAFTVVARRKLSYHMVQTYLPSIFFIIITWLCFLVPSRMVEARIGISMTTLLTLTAMFASVRESTPTVSYVKAIDIWMVFCIFFVFLTLLEFSLLVWIRSFREDREEKRLEHERQARRGVKEKEADHHRPSVTSIRSDDVKRYEQIAEFTEKWAFLIFSVVFIVFNIFYWSWLLSQSDYFNWTVNAKHNGALVEED